jgi:hypothetical protein
MTRYSYISDKVTNIKEEKAEAVPVYTTPEKEEEKKEETKAEAKEETVKPKPEEETTSAEEKTVQEEAKEQTAAAKGTVNTALNDDACLQS